MAVKSRLYALGLLGFRHLWSAVNRRIVIMGVRGFNWGLDFTGGTVLKLRSKNRLKLT